MLKHRLKSELGGGDFGWLKAHHHFRVTADGNPDHDPLRALIVWNDDEIAPGTGFSMHPHRNMEIVTYVREGAVTHRDSSGGIGVTVAGDVQVMSAGSGILHEERNAETVPLKIFQIWLRPRELDTAPRWSTQPFPKGQLGGRLLPFASGLASDLEAVPLRADARVLAATLKAGHRVIEYPPSPYSAYLVPSSGSVLVNGERVEAGSGIAIIDEQTIAIEAISDAEIVLVETY